MRLRLLAVVPVTACEPAVTTVPVVVVAAVVVVPEALFAFEKACARAAAAEGVRGELWNEVA